MDLMDLKFFEKLADIPRVTLIDLPLFQGVHRLKLAAIFMKLLPQRLKSFICSMMEIRFAQ